MPRNFCTLFDLSYLPRGLVTCRSLRRVMPEANLTVLCMDQATKRLLDDLREPGLTTLGIDELEHHDAGLVSVRDGRTRGEYCWTSTPALCRYLFDREPSIEELTYLDADLMFFSSPEPLFDERRDASVLIVPHRYAPQWAALERTHGIYNVEWVTFRRDGAGLRVLDWWRDRCIEWCYARVEDGKFGDQKYLDEWPLRFPGVHVLEHPGAGLAPWNGPRHRVEGHGDVITVDGRPLVFFHYHSLALHKKTLGVRALSALNLPLGPRADEGVAWTTNYPLGDTDRALIWRPYLRRLRSAGADIRSRDPDAAREFVPLNLRKVLHPVAVAALRHAEDASHAARHLRFTRNSSASMCEWEHDAAREMLALVRSQLAAPEAVPPFRGFRYALDAVLADDGLGRPVALLDIGCGVGHYSELVARWFDGDVLYTGADASREMIEVATATWPSRHFEHDDVLASRLDYGAYDVLLAGALVDVLAEWRSALDALFSSSAPYVILHRQRLTRGKTRVRRAAGYAGQETYRTILGQADLDAALVRHGREIAGRVPIEPGVETFVLRKAAA